MPRTDYVTSPLNYVGGKSKLLPQIMPLMPSNINTFYDLFAGGLNVGVNVKSNKLAVNEYNINVLNLLKYFYETPSGQIIEQQQHIIRQYDLNKVNADQYYMLRQEYNRNPSPQKLYALICHSFSNQIRFNNNGAYNNPFGKRTFNDKLQNKLTKFCEKLQQKEVFFSHESFEYITDNQFIENDYVYCDPPYYITGAAYNKTWKQQQENLLYETLDKLNDNGVTFGLSNVVTHKGKTNPLLEQWMKKYYVHNLNINYSNCWHNTAKTGSQEIFVTNIKVQQK